MSQAGISPHRMQMETIVTLFPGLADLLAAVENGCSMPSLFQSSRRAQPGWATANDQNISIRHTHLQLLIVHIIYTFYPNLLEEDAVRFLKKIFEGKEKREFELSHPILPPPICDHCIII